MPAISHIHISVNSILIRMVESILSIIESSTDIKSLTSLLEAVYTVAFKCPNYFAEENFKLANRLLGILRLICGIDPTVDDYDTLAQQAIDNLSTMLTLPFTDVPPYHVIIPHLETFIPWLLNVLSASNLEYSTPIAAQFFQTLANQEDFDKLKKIMGNDAIKTNLPRFVFHPFLFFLFISCLELLKSSRTLFV